MQSLRILRRRLPGPSPCGFCGHFRYRPSLRRPRSQLQRCAVLQAGAAREDGQSRSKVVLHGCDFISYGGGCLKGVAASRRTVSSLPFQHPRNDWSRWPSMLSGVPMSSLAWSPPGRLASRRAKRRRRLSSWPESQFQAMSSLVGRPECSQCEPCFLVDHLLDILLPIFGAVGAVALPPQFPSEEGCCLHRPVGSSR